MPSFSQTNIKHCSLLAAGVVAGAALAWSVATLHEPSSPPPSGPDAPPSAAANGDTDNTLPLIESAPAERRSVLTAPVRNVAPARATPRGATTPPMRSPAIVEASKDNSTSAKGIEVTQSFSQPAVAQSDEALRPTRRILIEPRQHHPGILMPVRPPAPLVLELSPESRAPAALAELEEQMTAAQSGATAKIAEEFTDRVEEAAASHSEEELAEVWDTQQEDADSQFRNIFGEAALHLKQTAAAAEAQGLPAR